MEINNGINQKRQGAARWRHFWFPSPRFSWINIRTQIDSQTPLKDFVSSTIFPCFRNRSIRPCFRLPIPIFMMLSRVLGSYPLPFPFPIFFDAGWFPNSFVRKTNKKLERRVGIYCYWLRDVDTRVFISGAMFVWFRLESAASTGGSTSPAPLHRFAFDHSNSMVSATGNGGSMGGERLELDLWRIHSC